MKKSFLLIFVLILSIAFTAISPICHQIVLADDFVQSNITDNELLRYLKTLAGSDTLNENSFSALTNLTIENSTIKNLAGLEQFNFDNLIKFDMSNNKINSIPSNIFVNMPNLVEIDLSQNEITSITIPTLSTIATINLFSNKISSADFGDISTVCDINLSKNSISSISSVVLPEGSNVCKLDLTNNKITDISSDFSSIHNLVVGVQNISDSSSYDTPYTIAYYALGENYVNALCKLKVNNVTTLDLNGTKTLRSGSYEISFVDSVSLNNLYDPLDNTTSIYQPINFVVRPDISQVKICLNNVEVSGLYNITEATTFNIISSNENYTLKYRINGSEFSVGTSFTIDQRGTYSIAVCASEDGYDSLYKTFFVDSNIGFSAGLSFLYILLGVACGGVVIFLTYVYINRDKYFEKGKFLKRKQK